jgi:hypothetical protein
MISRLVFASLFASALVALGAGCTSHAPAALAVDTPLVPYQAPDVAELTGEDLSSEDPADVEDGDPSGELAPAPAPMPAAPKAPEAPTKPAAAPAKPSAPAKPGK